MDNFEKTALSTNMQEELIYLIIKRLTSTINSEEAAALQAWISESKDNQRIFNEVSDIWLATYTNSTSEFNSFEALKKVKMKLNETPKESSQQKSKIFINPWLKVAAFALFLITVGGLGYYAGVAKNAPPSSFTEIEAPMGSRSRVNLPDGTKVWLNGGSNLKFSNSFNKTDRNITITGEGYFDVSHNENLPFVVNAKEIRIKVLGTAFNIKAYPDEAIETTLERGSLAIEKITENGSSIPQTVLEPNQRATYIKNLQGKHLSDIDKLAKREQDIRQNREVNSDSQEQLLISKNVETHIFTSWKDNKLVFRNEPFESLTIKLERWYGVSIKIEDAEIEKYHFNGTFEKETIQDVLKIIHYTLPIKYTFDHDQISISLDKTAWKGGLK